jgi:hypothetical protein
MMMMPRRRIRFRDLDALPMSRSSVGTLNTRAECNAAN